MRHLVRSTDTSGRLPTTVDVTERIEASVSTVRERYPDAEISVAVEHDREDLAVHADEHVDQVFVHLLENAIVHAADGDPAVEVAVTATADSVRVAVHDEGPGLPERQRVLLETGEITEFDDPRAGYGLNIVRFLVESYDGDIETTVDDTGTTISVALPRPGTGTLAVGVESSRAELAGVRPAVPHLSVTLAAAILAGIPYGVAAEQLGGSVAAIGVFYGIEHPIVGWLTHTFHSVVFAFAFAGLVTLAPERVRASTLGYVSVGVAWALFLWTVAAGVVAPVWLRLLGIPAVVPRFSLVLLVSHLAWGVSLGALTAWGYAHVTPRLARIWRGAGRGVEQEPLDRERGSNAR